MSQIVQAKCPHCKTSLRIPLEWASRPMRCKHCRQVFQARVRANSPESETGITAATPLPPTRPAAPPPVPAAARPGRRSADPFDFEDEEPGGTTPLPVRRRPRSSEWWKYGLIAGCVLVIAGVGVAVFGPDLGLFGSSDNANAVVQGPEGPGRPTGRRRTQGKVIPGAFPRRALLINVNNYLLANPLHYGSPRTSDYPGSSTAALRDQLQRPPMNIPASQITELSDGGRTPHSTVKSVIEQTIVDFLDAAREQDRLIVLFAGHAVDLDKEAYLVPLEGDLSDAKTLIPLTWVYDQLAKCTAREKLLVLDVCRFPPARGLERPSGGPMGEILDAKLQNPPPGVQVWSACVKDQQSIEFEGGSVFLQAMIESMQERIPGIQEPTNPLPLDVLVPRVNQYLAKLLAPAKLEQTSRLTGQPRSGGADYDPTEPFPDPLVLKPPAPPDGAAAGLAQVQSILDEINKIPPVRLSVPGGDSTLKVSHLPPFSAKALEPYRPDYRTWKDLEEMVRVNPERYALRAAVLEAMDTLRGNAKFVMRESLTGGGGPISPQVKAQFLQEQKEPGLAIFELERALSAFEAAAEKREEEPSKRWQAHYDYALARMRARLVYTFEYNHLLAQVRSDSLPELQPFHNGWRVASQPRVESARRESKIRDMVKEIDRSWKRIAREHAGTPWALLAKREKLTALGLEWKASRD